jgi:type IV pilus assembly protein PilF
MKSLLLITLTAILVSCSSSQEKKISKTDKKANIYYAQGTRNLVDKEYTKALKNLLEANTYRPKDTKIHTNLGMAYYFKKNSDLALKHLRYAIELDPKNTDAKLNIATIHMEQNNYNDAEKLYQEVLKDLIYERQFRTYYNLGLLEIKRKNLPKALSYFKKSTDINENYCPAFFQSGKIFYSQGQYKKALKMFKESSLGTCYQNPEPHYMQALSLMKLRQWGEANIKLDEIAERFAMTKYESMASRAKVKLRQLKEDSYNQQMKAKNYNRNILTPDF